LDDLDSKVHQESVSILEHNEDETLPKQPELGKTAHKSDESTPEIPEVKELEHEDSSLNKPISEMTGIGSRLPTRERHPPCEWWRPWEPPQINMGQEEEVTNTQRNHMVNLGTTEKC